MPCASFGSSADFNLLKFPHKDAAMDKIRDLTLLSDIFPTGFHGAVQARVLGARGTSEAAAAGSYDVCSRRRPRSSAIDRRFAEGCGCILLLEFASIEGRERWRARWKAERRWG
eukprot:6177073-Pleurochrysis_carterae.AAC.1